MNQTVNKTGYVKKSDAFSAEDIRKMFVLRSKGMKIGEIAPKYNVSTWLICQILKRRQRAEVEIPPNVLETVASMGKRTYQSTTTKKRTKRSTHLIQLRTRADALAAFTESVLVMNDAKLECMKYGISDDSLRLLTDSLREN